MSIKLDKTTARSTNIVFGIDSAQSIGKVNFETPIETIAFHIMPVNTLFLLCFTDMDQLCIFFNNITNELV